MKKRRFSFILAMIFVIPCLFFLSACGKGDDGGGSNPEDPSKYTLSTIQKLTNDELSKNYNSLSVKLMGHNIEFAKQNKDNKEYYGMISSLNSKKFTFVKTLDLAVYKDSTGKYYYAKKHYEKDGEATEANLISFTSNQSSYATDSIVKNMEGIIEFSHFETYLYEKDGTWKTAKKYGENNYSLTAFELTSAQKKWLLRTEVTKEKVGEDAVVGGNYYKLTYNAGTNNSDFHFFASEIGNVGKYTVVLPVYEHSENDAITETNLIDYLNLFDGKEDDYNQGYFYYRFQSDESLGIDFNLGVHMIDYYNYNITNDFYVLENGKYNKNCNLSDFGLVGSYSTYDCIGKTYAVSDNGEYYILTNFVDGTLNPSFFNDNETTSFDKVRYDITKSEFDAMVASFSNNSLKQELSYDELNLSEDLDEKDQIIKLYGEDAYNFSFKMDDYASRESFTARIKSTVLSNYEYSDVNITDESKRYSIQNALIDQEVEITFVDQKLSSITIICKLNDKFKLTNSENDPDKKFSISNFENEQQITCIEINKNILNFDFPNISEYRNDSMDETEDVEIELRNVYGGNQSLSEINGTPIKAGMEINLSDIVVPTTPNGVVFEGWYLDFYYTVPAFKNGKLTVSKYDKNMILYAKYSNLPKLTIELNGGTMTQFNLVTVRLGEMDKIIDMPYKRGYEFIGFFTDPELTKPYNFREEDIVEDTTIYAGYAKLYVVKFDTKGGKEVGNFFVKEGAKGVYLPEAVEKIGYIFKGWKLAGDDTIYNGGYSVSEGITSDLSFEAVYEEGYVLKVYERLYDGIFVLNRVITISKTCPEGYTVEELYDNLKDMFTGYAESCKVFIDEALTTELTEWPTGNINIYISETAE